MQRNTFLMMGFLKWKERFVIASKKYKAEMEEFIKETDKSKRREK